MRTKIFMKTFIGAFMFMLALSTFNSKAFAQSRDEKLQQFIENIKEEFNSNDQKEIRSVTVVKNSLVLDMVSNEMPADFMYEIIVAMKTYVDVNYNQDIPKVQDFVKDFNELALKGVTLMISDAHSEKSYKVQLTPEQYSMFAIIDLDDNDELMMEIMSYLPVETFVKLMNLGATEGVGDKQFVVYEKGTIYFIVEIPAEQYEMFLQLEEESPGSLKELMKSSLLENQDSKVASMLEYIRNKKCKLGFKIWASGQKTIVVILD